MDMTYEILLKRVQEPVHPNDGARMLVDRLRPRGRHRDAMELTDWYRGATLKQALEACQQQPALIQYVIYGPCNISDGGLADRMRNRH
jgi:hypothetical protein